MSEDKREVLSLRGSTNILEKLVTLMSSTQELEYTTCTLRAASKCWSKYLVKKGSNGENNMTTCMT